MAIKSYSLAREGDKLLLPNFRVREFACKGKDSGDKVVIDDALVVALQKIRDCFGKPLLIHSAYRTPEHNKREGGSPTSQHLYGKAADFHIEGVPHLEVAQYAESMGLSGIGLYPWGVHVDTRAGKSFWQEVNEKLVTVATFGQAKEVEDMATVESKKIYVNGVPQQIRAIRDKGENYVHLRDLVSALGGVVSYDSASKTITVDSGR